MKRLIFIDSSVLFSAVYSPTGGSSKLFTIKDFSLIAATIVLAEVEKNVRKKLSRFHLQRFFMLAEQLSILDYMPDTEILRQARAVIIEKDAVILALAKQAETDCIVTLDKKDFLQEQVIDFVKPKEIVTPKLLLKSLS